MKASSVNLQSVVKRENGRIKIVNRKRNSKQPCDQYSIRIFLFALCHLFHEAPPNGRETIHALPTIIKSKHKCDNIEYGEALVSIRMPQDQVAPV
ncbi:hypothetical protein V1477_007867 [Vespula maculifrons]|uniref:Uncharacterized protein n=1 Tax=Vespula maculifrons TaxID=7453 RepID=A0ABD2CFZ3_VESMC